MDRRTFLHLSLAGAGVLATGCGTEAPAGGPLPLSAGLLAFAGGRTFEIDLQAHRIAERGPAGGVLLADLNYPVALAGLADGGVVVLDRGDAQLIEVGPTGDARAFGGDALASPADVAVSDDLIFVTDSAAHQVVVFDRTGRVVDRWTDGFSMPRGIAAGPDGTLHVVDAGNGRVRTFAPDGTPGPSYGADAPWWLPRPIAVDGEGYAYVGCPTTKTVWVFDAAGRRVEARPLTVSPVHLSVADGERVHVGAV